MALLVVVGGSRGVCGSFDPFEGEGLLEDESGSKERKES